ncbi:MAG: hypothetical protein NTY99_01200 [DPANN group archaeon]|nr:hypothetical protein [DPANN group archaeon]
MEKRYDCPYKTKCEITSSVLAQTSLGKEPIFVMLAKWPDGTYTLDEIYCSIRMKVLDKDCQCIADTRKKVLEAIENKTIDDLTKED